MDETHVWEGATPMALMGSAAALVAVGPLLPETGLKPQ